MSRAGSWDCWAAPSEDNVRQNPMLSTDRRACGHNPWRGKVVEGAHGRSIISEGGERLCGVCRFARKYGTHCFLYEVCDRCGPGDSQESCPTSQEVARQSSGAA